MSLLPGTQIKHDFKVWMNEYMVRYIFTGTIILLIAVYGCEKNAQISRTASISDNEPDQKFYKSRIIITESGMTSAIVEAESVSVYMDSNFTSVGGGISIDFFSKKGEHTSKLTAQKGEVWGLYDEVDSLKATGDIVIVSTDAEKRMETASSMCWISSVRKIYADGLVKLISEDAVEQGIHFEAKDDLSEYRMDNVSGVFEGKDIKLPGR